MGAPIALRDFIETIEALSGMRLNTRDVPTPPSDPPITFCNNAKARDLLGFAPETPVQEGLARMWEWFTAWRKDAAG